MPRRNPEYGNQNPSLIRALFNAIEESVSPNLHAKERQGIHGKRWIISHRTTITPTEGALHIYIDNPTDDKRLDVEGVDLFTNGTANVDLSDEPTVDTSTFNTDEFRNTRSSVTLDPPWNAYWGLDSNVTISDTGRQFSVDRIQSGGGQSVGQDSKAPGYIIDENSSALLTITNETSNDIIIAITMYCHEHAMGPDLTQLAGEN